MYHQGYTEAMPRNTQPTTATPAIVCGPDEVEIRALATGGQHGQREEGPIIRCDKKSNAPC